MLNNKNNKRTFKTSVLDNFQYRIGMYHPTATVSIGCGDADADIMVIQSHLNNYQTLKNDAVSGALNSCKILNGYYRATTRMVKGMDNPKKEKLLNRYYLKELIEIINPLVVIACGPEVTSFLKNRRIKTFSSHTGKRFKVDGLDHTFFAVMDPTEYGDINGSKKLKQLGKEEWTKLASIYKKRKEKRDKERWA